MDEISLGKVLQQARKEAKLTQQELCQKANLSYSTLAKIERGAIKSPSIFTIQSIATALNLSLDELIGDSAVSPTPQSVKQRSKSGVRFVYFDINGCLVRFYHRAFTAISEITGKQADVIETNFWHYNDAVCRGEISIEEFNETLGDRFELPGFQWQEYYLDAIEPIDEMVELLNWAAEHYNVGLLSNIMPGLIDGMMERGILPAVQYSAIVDSSKEKTIKPEPEIYEIAEEKTGLKPEEILFIDDSRANIMTAEKRGWKVLWFDDYRPDESASRVRKALEY